MIVAALLASPFLLDYDLVILAAPLAWLASEAASTGFRELGEDDARRRLRAAGRLPHAGDHRAPAARPAGAGGAVRADPEARG